MKQTTTNGASSLIEEEQTLHRFTQLQAKNYYNIQFFGGNHNNNNNNNSNNNSYYYYLDCAFSIKIIKSALHLI